MKHEYPIGILEGQRQYCLETLAWIGTLPAIEREPQRIRNLDWQINQLELGLQVLRRDAEKGSR